MRMALSVFRNTVDMSVRLLGWLNKGGLGEYSEEWGALNIRLLENA